MRNAIVVLCVGLALAPAVAFAAGPAAQTGTEDAAGKTGAGKAGVAKADTGKVKAAPAGDMVLSGLSILGNDETPKELVIVPWKSSQLADAPGISRLLDDSTQPVDKDVFLRELSYYDLIADPDGE
ncbi:hypothetical protein [Lysobacter solisilvae (ex Woo and Kim 2020)]|uniref:Uncharacterized protein n=1 Tax=Agrilutibacter terrestris TaxID=2865112 RepID=A0A7H0FU76_9GAMM|nr:hypothetical protein [Lysobacter terrestris]QNP39592.1 hypothetical protein H8B22_08615 [Lysobacter terrestris]